MFKFKTFFLNVLKWEVMIMITPAVMAVYRFHSMFSYVHWKIKNIYKKRWKIWILCKSSFSTWKVKLI